MSVNSMELETWELEAWYMNGPMPEAMAKSSFRVHVEEERYADKHGDLRCVVKLKIKDETNRTFNASGVLIGPDLVLTSAHNVRFLGGEDYVSRAVSVRAYIGYHRQGSSSKGVGVQDRSGTRVIVLQKWESSGFTWHNDMALVKLGSRFTQVKPASYQAPSLGDSDVLVVGYPGDNTTQVLHACSLCKVAGCMYEVAGQAKYNAEKLLEYKLSTMPGNSGGPVFLKSTPRAVIATHSSGDSQRGRNYAAPVNIGFIEAGKCSLDQLHRSALQHVVMFQQGNTSTWTISWTERVWPSQVTAQRFFRLCQITLTLPHAGNKRAQATVSEPGPDSEEEEDGFILLRRNPPQDAPSTHQFTRHRQKRRGL